MLENYLPILVFIALGIAVGIVAIVFSRLFAPHNPNSAKLSPYECGFPEFGNARMQFDVRFYLVAILFIIFDLEIAFLFPWAVVFRALSWPGIIGMGIFLGILVVGFIYEWRKGALEWE
ncbi:MAG: NADH-quinone oxidoreductase subunit A [Legionellales bacterium]|nr:MAG: NADH-quinone oxidoreductase subunit A [Legionellales bacterium]